jgi:hypothetical protein
MFRINLDWDICAIRDQVNLEIYSKNFKKDKEEIINKIDHYVGLYQKLHDIYTNKVLDNNRKFNIK